MITTRLATLKDLDVVAVLCCTQRRSSPQKMAR